jgi:hypothetical protein
LFEKQPDPALAESKLDVSDLPHLDEASSYDISQLGLEDGTDTLETYTDAVLDLLSNDQMFYLWRRSTARAKSEPNIPKTLARALFAGQGSDGTDGATLASTFVDSFEFLEQQASFDMIFSKPVKLEGQPNAKRLCATTMLDRTLVWITSLLQLWLT